MATEKPAYPTLNLDRMPEYSQYSVAKATFKAMLRFFERPGELERFEAWKAERDARLAAEQNNEE